MNESVTVPKFYGAYDASGSLIANVRDESLPALGSDLHGSRVEYVGDPRLRLFHFNVGDTKDNPLGLTADVVAYDRAQACDVLNSHLDTYNPGEPIEALEGPTHSDEPEVQMVRIWLNGLTFTAEDIDDEYDAD